MARAGTPASRANSRSSVSGDGVGRGYTLAKGAIAEDVEEEETENGREMVVFFLLMKVMWNLFIFLYLCNNCLHSVWETLLIFML